MKVVSSLITLYRPRFGSGWILTGRAFTYVSQRIEMFACPLDLKSFSRLCGTCDQLLYLHFEVSSEQGLAYALHYLYLAEDQFDNLSSERIGLSSTCNPEFSSHSISTG